MRVPSRTQAPGRPHRCFQAGQSLPAGPWCVVNLSTSVCSAARTTRRQTKAPNRAAAGCSLRGPRGARTAARAARPGPRSLGSTAGPDPWTRPGPRPTPSLRSVTFPLSPAGTEERESLLAKQRIFLKDKKTARRPQRAPRERTVPFSDPHQRARLGSHCTAVYPAR